MNKINAFSVFGVMAMLACSSGTDPIDDVSLKIKNQNLIIENNTASLIFYFVIEAEFAAVIDWAAGFSTPYIESGSKTTLPFSEIANSKEDPVTRGDRILFYWWTAENMEQPDVHYESITIK